MKLQIIQDSKGKDAGVFIPMDDWALIKTNYPDVDKLDNNIPEWQQHLLDKRLEAIGQNPDNVGKIDELLDELDKDI